MSLITALDDASVSRFHFKAALVAGVGFFTDAYDLFIIGIASVLIAADWGLTTGHLALVNSTMLGAAFLGAMVFGRVADLFGRKKVYGLEAAIMVVGALGCALSPSLWWLVGFRFLLGFGVGGDYPVSAVLMSEYANRKDRGKLVGLVFGTQALGLIVGPLVALILLGGGLHPDLAWRVMLGLGALPAAAVVYLRRRMPESPRYQAQVQGQGKRAASQIAAFSNGKVSGNGDAISKCGRTSLRSIFTSKKMLILMLGTAGTWFLLDYAYYGNTISTPLILGLIAPGASLIIKVALQLAIFAVAAVPGYILAIIKLDKVGHCKMQIAGFTMMAVCFGILAVIPGLTGLIVPFMLIYGLSYFFTQYGPNMTTFILPSELFPVGARTTGHGFAAGVGKLGAFIGVFLFPLLQGGFGLNGTLGLTAAVAVGGALLTLVLPEPAGKSLEEI